MLYSVVIPVFNGEDTIKRAITSCIKQTIPPLEIIVVDDGSTDSTIYILEQIIRNNLSNIRLITKKFNSGPSESRNAGWNMAIGDYVAFLDADDIWNKNKMEIMKDLIHRYPNCSLFGHGYAINNIVQGSASKMFDLDKVRIMGFRSMLIKNFTQTSCVIVNRLLNLRFNETMNYSEDYDLWLRISKNNCIVFYDENLTILNRSQLSKGGVSEKRIKMRLGEMKAYRNVLKSSGAMIILIPFFVIYSFIKHLYSLAKISRSKK